MGRTDVRAEAATGRAADLGVELDADLVSRAREPHHGRSRRSTGARRGRAVAYRCRECEVPAPQWLGRCPECGEWGSLDEVEEPPTTGAALTGAVRGAAPIRLAEVDPSAAARRATGLPELDRVLGGGLVPGSVTLVGGEPGIGKSTLALQALGALATSGATCLLASGEESPEQVRLRAERLGLGASGVVLVAETSLPALVGAIDDVAPDVLVVDSIQTLAHPDVAGVAGSVAQVRDCATALVRLAKQRELAVVLIGHVTKEGTIAGPRVLEHVVDTVLAFEGDRHHALRMVRALKHRFGTTAELGLFEMTEAGVRDLADASRLFLADRRPGAVGSVVAPVLEAGRPLLVEVQALVAPSCAPMPRRSAPSFDQTRLSMLLAVLRRHAGIGSEASDVYASVAGGVRISEPGADLALAIAVASAREGIPVLSDVVAVGEIGLGGEVRQVTGMERRLAEAARLGFRRAIVPASSPEVDGIEMVRVTTVGAGIDAVDLSVDLPVWP